jgi:hypothetical protein
VCNTVTSLMDSTVQVILKDARVQYSNKSDRRYSTLYLCMTVGPKRFVTLIFTHILFSQKRPIDNETSTFVALVCAGGKG